MRALEAEPETDPDHDADADPDEIEVRNFPAQGRAGSGAAFARRPAAESPADTGAAGRGGNRRHTSLPPLPLPHITLRNPLQLLREGARLASLEADQMTDLLTDGLLAFSEEADKFISRTNAERADAEIWSTITREEAATIAGALVDAGRKYAPMAFMVRQLARSYTGLRIGLITLPRFYETMQHYAQHGGFLLWSPPLAPGAPPQAS